MREGGEQEGKEDNEEKHIFEKAKDDEDVEEEMEGQQGKKTCGKWGVRKRKRKIFHTLELKSREVKHCKMGNCFEI